MSSIGERLKEERQRLGMSQTELGELGGVLKQAQIKYEKGERFPDAAFLAAIAQAGADIQYIVTGVKSSVALAPDERLLVERYRQSPQPLKDAALRVILGAPDTPSGAATQTFHAPVSGGVAGRDIVKKGRK